MGDNVQITLSETDNFLTQKKLITTRNKKNLGNDKKIRKH
jgi:hypothetical protein